MSKGTILMQFSPEFQRQIFERVIKKYGSSLKAGRHLKLPPSSIRGYKNLNFDSVPESLVRSLVKKGIIKQSEIENKLIKRFDKEQEYARILRDGRNKRNKKFIELRRNIPKIEEVIKNNKLNLEIWFQDYANLLNTGFRKTTADSDNKCITLRYQNYTPKGFKEFVKKIPNFIEIDEEFMYFFGLWCGDRSGGKRFGICNQNQGIIEFTEGLLKKYGQEVEKILYIQKSLQKPKVSYDKIFLIDKEIRGWVLSVHSTNGVLTSFFRYLFSNLDFFLTHYNTYPFFAGLFDAEGNVSLHNKSVRWACKNDELVKLYTKFLRKLDLYDGYDGGSLISYNKEEFYGKILPFMKQDKKINLVKLMCRGIGNLPKRHIDVLKHLTNNPDSTSRGIAKALKENKVYSELKLLNDFGFLSYEGFPHRYSITSKGLKSLGDLKL